MRTNKRTFRKIWCDILSHTRNRLESAYGFSRREVIQPTVIAITCTCDARYNAHIFGGARVFRRTTINGDQSLFIFATFSSRGRSLSFARNREPPASPCRRTCCSVPDKRRIYRPSCPVTRGVYYSKIERAKVKNGKGKTRPTSARSERIAYTRVSRG